MPGFSGGRPAEANAQKFLPLRQPLIILRARATPRGNVPLCDRGKLIVIPLLLWKNLEMDLRGTWTLKGNRIAVAAELPGDNFSALLRAGKIPDPYWERNEQDVLRVGRSDWTFERTIEIDPKLLDRPSVFLNCDQVDTLARFYINDQLVGESDNMFRRWRWEVKHALRRGKNKIRIEIDSPEKAAIEKAKRLPYPIPCTSFVSIHSPHRNLLRKAQCHGGWDWGPCLMVSGVYGDLYLRGVSLGRIEHVYTEQKFSGKHCDLQVFCEVYSPQGGKSQFGIEIDGKRCSRHVDLHPGLNILSDTIRLAGIRRWWPAGHGDQPLYDLTVSAGDDTVRKKIGFRTLVVRSDEDRAGLSLVFNVNGRDIFCKGANWIPCDALPSRQTRPALNQLLSSAIEANMNMLRVWGGGQFESEDFYELCDEKGLLLWHDFMFSCALYPADAEFSENVRQEIEYQVKRLRDHASIAIWCGNNENVGALNWYEESRKNRDRYLVDYDRLNEGVIGKTVDECDPTRRFWPSSPCGGRNDYSDCWHNDSRGDMHFWSVWHEVKPFEAYYEVKPRFCSEFGYQSFPSLETISTFAAQKDFNVSSPVMEHHQKNPGGNTRIVEMFTQLFRFPDGFENFVYLSQVQQALAIKAAVEHWRTLRPHCMGTLFWQLNDLWPVCSWSSIEYGGRWKLVHYAAKRFYAPLLITAVPVDGAIEILAVNDHTRKVPVQVMLEVKDFSGKTFWQRKLEDSLAKESARRLARLKEAEITERPNETFLTLRMQSDEGVCRNEFFFRKFKECDLQAAKVKAAAVKVDGRPGVKLTTDKPAFFVSLSTPDGAVFSDNCFSLIPGETREIAVSNGIQPESQLQLKHLRETYK